MRSSAPASLGVFAINGDGSCFCSTATGLLGRTALGAKTKKPLSIAVASNDLESVEELLEYRASLEKQIRNRHKSEIGS